MGSTFWIAIAVISIVSIVCSSVVKIVKASRTGGGKLAERVEDLEEELHDLRGDFTEARQRIEVLEKIVTDQKYDLGRQIDDLSAGS